MFSTRSSKALKQAQQQQLQQQQQQQQQQQLSQSQQSRDTEQQQQQQQRDTLIGGEKGTGKGNRRRHSMASSAQSAAMANTTTQSQSQSQQKQSQQQPAKLVDAGHQNQLVAPTVLSPLFGQRHQSMLSDKDDNQQLLTIPRSISQSQIQYAFSLIDVNQDGLIDIRELNHMLANLGIPLEDSLLERIIVTASKRGDSRISEEEFLDWISHFIQLSDNLVDNVSTTSHQSARTATPAASGASSRSAHADSPSASNSNSLTCASPSSSRASLKSRRHSFGRSSKTHQANQQAAEHSDDTARSSSSSGDVSGSRSKQAQADSLHHEQSLEKDCESDLRAAFKVFDLDGNGYITIDEIKSGLMLIGEKLTDKELRDLLKGTKYLGTASASSSASSSSSDALNEGKINIDEFVKLII